VLATADVIETPRPVRDGLRVDDLPRVPAPALDALFD
jgi:hypothetical protein